MGNGIRHSHHHVRAAPQVSFSPLHATIKIGALIDVCVHEEGRKSAVCGREGCRCCVKREKRSSEKERCVAAVMFVGNQLKACLLTAQ